MKCDWIIENIQEKVLQIISIIVSNCQDEALMQIVLNIYQSIINLSGTIGLKSTREKFLDSLTNFCVPNGATLLHSKNIYSCKTLFNIAHCLNDTFDYKSWHKILETLYRLDFLLKSN